MASVDLVDVTRRYLKAVESGAVGDELARFFHPEVVQVEYPNRLVQAGATRDLNGLLEGAMRGQTVVEGQRYDVRNVVAMGSTVAVEVSWSARLKVPLGKTPAGSQIKAEIAMFLDFRDELIVGQRNYDCYLEF